MYTDVNETCELCQEKGRACGPKLEGPVTSQLAGPNLGQVSVQTDFSPVRREPSPRPPLFDPELTVRDVDILKLILHEKFRLSNILHFRGLGIFGFDCQKLFSMSLFSKSIRYAILSTLCTRARISQLPLFVLRPASNPSEIEMYIAHAYRHLQQSIDEKSIAEIWIAV